MPDNLFSNAMSLLEILEKGNENDFPAANSDKSYVERFKELNRVFSIYPVEMGAMRAEIEQWKSNLSNDLNEIVTLEDSEERKRKIDELLEEDTIIFLNKHGAEHICKVQEKALEILKCFNNIFSPTIYEIFFLMCSISVHDIGNFLGRKNHEKIIMGMLDKDCKNIVDDTVERRIIARIAGVHGGSIKGSKDTISVLKDQYMINNKIIREQMLAAVLRFADELADDSTRANKPALENGILGSASEIFHIYSSKLHTVMLQQNPVKNAYDVVLKYEMDEKTAKKQFDKATEKIYLLDEIYERTIKMERERRYCMRFLRGYCSIESIKVEISINSSENVFEQENINYTLQEKGYPEHPYKSIKDVDRSILSGEEMALKLSQKNEG